MLAPVWQGRAFRTPAGRSAQQVAECRRRRRESGSGARTTRYAVGTTIMPLGQISPYLPVRGVVHDSPAAALAGPEAPGGNRKTGAWFRREASGTVIFCVGADDPKSSMGEGSAISSESRFGGTARPVYWKVQKKTCREEQDTGSWRQPSDVAISAHLRTARRFPTPSVCHHIRGVSRYDGTRVYFGAG